MTTESGAANSEMEKADPGGGTDKVRGDASGGRPARFYGLGSSDIPAIFGVAYKRTAMDVWLEQLGLVDRDDVDPGPDDPRYWGNEMEPALIRAFVHEHGGEVRTSETCWHRDLPWARATPDGLWWNPKGVNTVERQIRLLECKNKSWHMRRDWGDPDTDHVPMEVALQVYWQMFVTDIDFATVVMLLNGNEYREYPLVREIERIEKPMVAQVTDFWEVNIGKKIRPALLPDDAGKRYLAAVFPMHGEAMLEADDEQTYSIARWLARSKQTAKYYKTEIQRQEQYLAEMVGRNVGIHGRWGKFTWRRSESRGVDWKAVAHELPSPSLAKYARHNRGCGALRKKDPAPCTCGFIASVMGSDGARDEVITRNTRPGTRGGRFTPSAELLEEIEHVEHRSSEASRDEVEAVEKVISSGGPYDLPGDPETSGP